MSKKPYYITTPIYYPSGNPHIGHCYTTVACDSIARFRRMQGYDVIFLTGTDEHGLKIEQKAAEKDITPKEYVDEIVKTFQALWEKMHVSYDRYIRTTDDYHIETVQKIFKRLYDLGYIYKGEYKGKYCTPCVHQIRRHVPVLRNNSAQANAHPTPAWRVMIFSALFSSSFSGAIYIAALFVQGGRITADLLEEFRARQLLEDATDRASSVFQGVPRLAITIGILILSLWLISFGRNLLRYGRFRIRFSDDFISVHMGILNRRRFHLRDSAVVFPDLRQNLVMKIFGMVSLHIRCPGYGSRRDTLPVLIPLVRQKTSWELLGKLHAPQRLEHPHLKAKSQPIFFWSFVWPPVIGIGAVIAVRLLTLWLFPHLAQMIHFFALMLIIPLLWFLVIRIVTLFTQSVSMDDCNVQFQFSRGSTFHTITVPRDHIVRADLMQTPIQKQYGVCHLYLICNGPKQQRFKLTALPEQAARTIIAALSADFHESAL